MFLSRKMQVFTCRCLLQCLAHRSQPPATRQRAQRSSKSCVVSSALCGCPGHPLQFISRQLPCPPARTAVPVLAWIAHATDVPVFLPLHLPSQSRVPEATVSHCYAHPKTCCMRKTGSCCVLFIIGLKLHFPQSLKSEQESLRWHFKGG